MVVPFDIAVSALPYDLNLSLNDLSVIWRSLNILRGVRYGYQLNRLIMMISIEVLTYNKSWTIITEAKDQSISSNPL